MSKRPIKKAQFKIKERNPLLYLFEPLERRGDYEHKRMFGCEAAYLDGKLSVILADGEEPWNGLMLATDRAHHASLQTQFKELVSHPILGKWLYLSTQDPEFESLAPTLVAIAQKGDPRIGVQPKPKKKKR